MKKILIVLFALVMLAGCAQAKESTEAGDFSKIMMDDANKTSVIYLKEDPANIYDTEKVKLYLTDVYRDSLSAQNDAAGVCSAEEFDTELTAYFERYDELKASYNELLLKLEEPVEDVKINGEVIVGIETVDDNGINTAFLYTNNVVKVIMGDKVEFYTVSDEVAAEWRAVYFDYMAFYQDEANRPCWYVQN